MTSAEEFTERPVQSLAPETRIVVLNALATTLPSRSRAVVVLRYWADLSVEPAHQGWKRPPRPGDHTLKTSI